MGTLLREDVATVTKDRGRNGSNISVAIEKKQPQSKDKTKKGNICDSKWTANGLHQPLKQKDKHSSSTDSLTKEGRILLHLGQVLTPLRYLIIMFKDYVKHCIATIGMLMAVVTIACALKGDVLLFLMITHKTYTGNFGDKVHQSVTVNESITQGPTTGGDYASQKPAQILPDYLQLPNEFNLQDVLYYIFVSNASALILYHLVCGFLQIYFYELKRKEPEKWKCQPHRFLTRSNEFHEMVTGTINLILTSISSGLVTCWILNGNYNTVYFKFDEYGYSYLMGSVVGLFLWFEAAAYYIHAFLHWPVVYRNVHKHHHRYNAPTAYSAIAMSPIELFMLYFAYMAPLFLVPINGMVFVVEIVYVYYFSIIDHSGIKMASVFPWQPDTMFHDDHHKYFHCNFGFNSYLFDWLHGTLRRKDRLYGEDIFWGRGRKKQK